MFGHGSELTPKQNWSFRISWAVAELIGHKTSWRTALVVFRAACKSPQMVTKHI